MLLLQLVTRAGAADPLPIRDLVTIEDMRDRDAWLQASLTPAGCPFSFAYDGRSSREFLSTWPRTSSSTELDALREQRIVRWTDPVTSMTVTMTSVVYRDYPTIEWTLRFANAGSMASPDLASIEAVDATFVRPAASEFIAHVNKGSLATREDFQPMDIPLNPGSTHSYTVEGGRPTSDWWPYFNIDRGDQGLIAAIGWPGKWTMTMQRDATTGLALRGGMLHFASSLLPRESIRSPLIALQFWHGGDWLRAQNVWRRWMMDHNVPRPGGRIIPPMLSTGHFSLSSDAAAELSTLASVAASGVHFDYWWMDAGWYVTSAPNNWWLVGTWEVDRKRYPGGIRAISDRVHEQGMKTILWFEPERVTPGSWLQLNHDSWLINSLLLNLGDPEAWQWAVKTIDGLIVSEGIDVYRQDFNIDPLPFWTSRDTEHRRGMCEMRYVEGYLALWDELRRRHPQLIIDSCASGGRRDDLETMRRAVPLLQSDDQSSALDEQCHNHGISLWLPYHGSGGELGDAYTARSCFTATLAGGPGNETAKRMVASWRANADLCLHDYYPLTPWSEDTKDWMAWQYLDPAAGRGIVLAFRRQDCADDSRTFSLRGLDPAASYVVTNDDRPGQLTMSGKDLMLTGLTITLTATPSAALYTLHRR